MGRFLDRGNDDFVSARNSEYVDKSAMIQYINETLVTENRFSCVSRCRRFGKSLAAKMLYAYYDRASDSRHLFEDLAIAKMPSYETHLNRYPTIFVDMTEFTTEYGKNSDVVDIMQTTIKKEVCELYPDVTIDESDNLMSTLFKVTDKTGDRFIMIIDEWDAICREFDSVSGVMDKYVDWLRTMFKSDATSKVFLGVYMTGIMPIKRYNTNSALSNFYDSSVIDPGIFAHDFGFTEEETMSLAKKHSLDVKELKNWYEGYKIGNEPTMYNPDSVMRVINGQQYTLHWYGTSAYNSDIAPFMNDNFDGVKDYVTQILAGNKCKAVIGNDINNMVNFQTKDDVLALLVHLGYLSYDANTKTCFVPNEEVRNTLYNAVNYIY